MSKSLRLRALVTERLSVAAEEIFELVERTIAEYEEELCRSKEEIQRRQQLLEENQRRQKVLQENQRRQQLLEENQRRQQLLEEKQRRQQLLEENQRRQQLLEEVQRQQVLLPTTDVKTEYPGSQDKMIPEVIEVTAVQVKTEDDEQSSLLHPILKTSIPTKQGEANQESKTDLSFDDDDVQRSGNSSDTDDSKDWEKKPGPSSREMEKDVIPEGYAEVLINDAFSTKTCSFSKMHRCPICEKMFVSGSSLKRHTLIHTGDRPFGCPVCQKSFTQKAHLKVHMCSHTGFKPFTCATCGRGFTRKNHYLKHTATHEEWGSSPNCNGLTL